MSVASNGDLMRTLLLSTFVDQETIVDDALLYPPLKVMHVFTSTLSYDRYKYDLRMGATRMLLFFFLNIQTTIAAGQPIYFSIPEANGKNFFMQVDKSPQVGHPPQNRVQSQGNVFQRVLSGTQENNGVAALKIVSTGPFNNQALTVLVMFDE